MASFKPIRLSYNTHEPVCETDENLSPIIYLHGATVFKESWFDIPQIIANATKRKSYSLDARNHGESEWTDHFNFEVNADDLKHFMDTQGIDKAILVGHSMGGMTAIKTALRWPDRVEKIVVEDMFVRKCPPETIKTILNYITMLQKAIEEVPADLDEESAKKLVMKCLTENIPAEMKDLTYEGKTKDDEDDLRFLKFRRTAEGRYSSVCNLEALKKALGDLETAASDPQGQFAGPALFIYGKVSPFLVGADEHHIKQFFPNAVFEGVEEAGHDVHFVKPLEFTDAVLKFIS